MIIGVIFENGIEIKRGICTGSKQWHKNYPQQYITICQDNINSKEETFDHDGIITFQELQDNGNGWEVVYDSNEKVDRTVDYPLPSWFLNGGSIPKHEHRMNEKGTIDTKFKGYYR